MTENTSSTTGTPALSRITPCRGTLKGTTAIALPDRERPMAALATAITARIVVPPSYWLSVVAWKPKSTE